MFVSVSMKCWRLMLLGIFVSALTVFWCANAACVKAASDTKSVAGTATAVNLKEGNWVYSTYVDKNNHPYASITGYDGNVLTLEVPAELGGVPVRSIRREAFCGNRYLTELTIAEGVTDIGKYCFDGCVGLKSISLPSTVKNIGDGAFYGCISLTSVELPDGVSKISNDCFCNCKHLERVALPSSVKEIGFSAFDGCSCLENITFDDGLQCIGNKAFRNCAALTEVSLPSSVSILGEGAFINCTALQRISLNDGLTALNRDTFRGCQALETVSFGEGIVSVGVSAFESCTALQTAVLGDSVTSIESLAFYGCASLKELTVGSGLEEIGFFAFNGCESLRKITVAESNPTFCSKGGKVYSADGTTLVLCPQGATGKLKVADGTQTVADYAVYHCNRLTGASFPESLRRLGMAAFMNCTDITQFSLPSEMEKLDCLSFGYYFDDGALVNASYMTAYGAAEGQTQIYCAGHEISFTPYQRTLLLNTDYVALNEGDSFDVKYSFVTGKKADIVWETSDPSVASVDQGRITVLSEGTATITASADGFDAATVRVNAMSVSDQDKQTDKTYDSRRMYRGQTLELSSVIDQIIDPMVTVGKFWYSTNPKVAVVKSDGEVTAVTNGAATITCRLPDGSENYFLINVTDKPNSFTLNVPEGEMMVGETAALLPRLLPTTSTDEVTWKSENPKIATVDDKGNVTAVSQGSCEITAVTAGGLHAAVTVKCVLPAETLSLNLETRRVYQGKEFNLEVQTVPAESQQRIVWRSSDPAVAKVNSKGKVTGVSFGTATIYAETADGKQASCDVSVVARAELLSLDEKKLTLNNGMQHQLKAHVFPSYSTETTDWCSWNSTDEAVATVDENGVVTAVGVGSCIINCKTGRDLISKCRVLVRQPAETVSVTGERSELYIGEVTALHATMTPENTTDQIEWSSSDETIAYVNANGAVKGKSVGSAVITVKSVNEVSGAVLTATYEIKVLKEAETVKLKRKSLSIRIGETDSLMYVLAPPDSNDTVTWHSTDESVAQVRSDGLITGVGPGTCYIYVETGSGCSARCEVTVTE